MNANKLFKSLSRSPESFAFLEKYETILEQSARIIIDFNSFINFDALVTKARTIILNNGLSLPFDNVLLDINGINIENVTNGKPQRQNLMLHVIPVEIATDISTFKVMLIQDMRPVGQDIYPRTHLVSLDTEIVSMPVVDTGTVGLGCMCYKKNPFSYGQLFKQIQSFTPGFKADCGFATKKCQSKLTVCQQLLCESTNITDIALASMIYTNMQCHQLVKACSARDTNGLKQMPSYHVHDEQSWQALMSGSTITLAFNDGSKFDEFNSKTSKISGKCRLNGMTYEPISGSQ